MSRKLTEDEVSRRTKEAHKEEVILVPGTFKDTHSLAIFRDEQFGDFPCRPYHIFKGHGHPQRGVEKNVKARLISIEKIIDRIEKTNGDEVTLDISTYKNLRTKARFVDKKNGEFWAVPSDVINGANGTRKNERYINTCIKKYNVINVSQLLKIQKKVLKTNCKIYKMIHWRTRRTIYCQGSYEASVVIYLNFNEIDYKWQPKIFKISKKTYKTPKGGVATYRPDMFLPDKNIWVEIKGRFMSNSEIKWLWFHNKFPNSELWTKQKLVTLGIKLYRVHQLTKFLIGR